MREIALTQSLYAIISGFYHSCTLGGMDDAEEAATRAAANREGVTHLSTGVAVVRGGTILMVRRAAHDYLGGTFELPGGGVEPDESLTESASREVTEETGLTISKVLATFAGFDYSTDKKPKVRQINFLATVEPGEVVLDPAEHDDFAWVDQTTYNNIQMSAEMRRCVVNALHLLESRKMADEQ